MKYIKFLYLLQGASYILFFYYSDGLGNYDVETSNFGFTNQLYSSGSDDDVAVFIGGVVCILAFFILLIKRYSLTGYFVIIFSVSIFQLLSLTLIQVGSILDTITYQLDPYLILGLILEIAILGIALITAIKEA